MIAELAVATGIAPHDLLVSGTEAVAAMIDVLAEQDAEAQEEQDRAELRRQLAQSGFGNG